MDSVVLPFRGLFATRLLFLLSLSFLCVLSGCANKWDAGKMDSGVSESKISKDVTMVPEESAVTQQSKKLTFDLTNHTKADLSYDMEPILEVKLNQAWYAVPVKGNASIPAIGALLSPEGTGKYTLDLDSYYGTLPKGHYRCLKKIGTAYASAEFDVA